jgi:serine/threonine protein kinase
MGFSHGDLKLENICARTSSHGNFKFTLIDFGMSQKLPQKGVENKPNPFFRGNFMFSSENQLQNYKPTIACDLISLIYVAYYFVENGLPWTDYIDLCMLNDPSVNLYDLGSFKKIRLTRAADF